MTPGDLPAFYRHSRDPAARWSAAFTPRERVDLSKFRERWIRRLATPEIRLRTVLVDGRVAGYVGRFPFQKQPMVGYWLGREFWGRGIATRALRAFLRADRTRPMFARVAHDHPASRRVLEKAGFVVVGRARSFAAARGRRLTELVLRLGGPDPRAPRRTARPPRRGPPRRSGSRAA